MIKEIKDILQNNGIDKIIIEEVHLEREQSNMKTYKALMFLQAAIVFMLYNEYPKIKIEYLLPSEWRSLCGIHTGKGIKREELKQKDIDFVQKIYNIKVNDDEADAICLGYAFIAKEKQKNEKIIEWI